MTKGSKIAKLFEIKTLRRRLAEVEAIRASAAVVDAEDALNRAYENEEVVQDNGVKRRKQRISELLDEPANVAVQNALIVNAFAKTVHEMEQAKEQTGLRQQELQDSQLIATDKQKDLARFLQLEERAKQFFERIKSAESLEALRSE